MCIIHIIIAITSMTSIGIIVALVCHCCVNKIVMSSSSFYLDSGPCAAFLLGTACPRNRPLGPVAPFD